MRAWSSTLSSLALAILPLPLATGAVSSQACSSAEHRQFDFWLGDWDVFTPDGKPAGTSRIERITDGCAVLENWAGKRGLTGKSLNIYDVADQQWHQFWVDSSGTRIMLDGTFADGKMVLQSNTTDRKRPGVKVTQRITWSKNADGSVRQLWDTSEDAGKTWTVSFDGKYVAAKKPAK